MSDFLPDYRFDDDEPPELFDERERRALKCECGIWRGEGWDFCGEEGCSVHCVDCDDRAPILRDEETGDPLCDDCLEERRFARMDRTT